MSYKPSLTNASTFCNRGISRLLLVASFLGMALLSEPVLHAQTTVGYLQQSPGHPIPASPALQLGNCPPITFNPADSQSLCVFGPFSLPGYAGSVYVGFSSITGDVPALSWAHNQVTELKATSNGLYNWGTDTNDISLYNTTANAVTYTIHFYFKGPAPDRSDLPPDPASLVLVVAGLESSYPGSTTPGTTATASALTPLANPNGNGGEYTIPASAYGSANPLSNWCPVYPATAPCVSSARTNVSSATCVPGMEVGTTCFTFSGGATATTDRRNTGWDIYQPNSPGLTELQLTVTQVPGDGIGFTLGYRICSTLVGNTLDSPLQLYNISTQGVATNPRPIVTNWGPAFSPMSPEGTLYTLTVGNALFTVNPSKGAMTEVDALSHPLVPDVLGLGAFAADPTTGTLYGVDGAGLFTVSLIGGLTRIGEVPGAMLITAMAFDGSGDLFLVDTGSGTGTLLKVAVAPNTVTVINSYPLSGLNRWSEFAALAIDPWSGKAYFTEGGYLYNLDLTTGTLSSPQGVTGVMGRGATPGTLASLTFTIGACIQPNNGCSPSGCI